MKNIISVWSNEATKPDFLLSFFFSPTFHKSYYNKWNLFQELNSIQSSRNDSISLFHKNKGNKQCDLAYFDDLNNQKSDVYRRQWEMSIWKVFLLALIRNFKFHINFQFGLNYVKRIIHSNGCNNRKMRSFFLITF